LTGEKGRLLAGRMARTGDHATAQGKEPARMPALPGKAFCS